MLPLTCVCARHFTWTGLTGVAEHSSLPEHLVSRVYDDACDFGFLVQSPQTGRVVLFTGGERVYRETDRERELIATRYTGVEQPGVTIDILND